MMRTAILCLATLAWALPSQAGLLDYLSPSKGWHKVKKYASDKVNRAKDDQKRIYGLKLPEDYDAARPLVILIHGVDSGQGMWWAMAQRLKESGYQSACFNYASDAPVQLAIDALTREMEALHKKHPAARVHILAHSMGGLVARGYIEGEHYIHPVERFIAIAPPNHGSCWAMCRWTLEFNEQYWLWKTNKDWSPLWAFTDGNGEAADDLKPGSKFLQDLNARPRRDGVRYTIIAGNHSAAARMGANLVDRVEGIVPGKNLWGLRHVKSGIKKAEDSLREQKGESDGVVEVESARLEGVDDIVLLHADHAALAMTINDKPPVAWETVKQRLANDEARAE